MMKKIALLMFLLFLAGCSSTPSSPGGTATAQSHMELTQAVPLPTNIPPTRTATLALTPSPTVFISLPGSMKGYELYSWQVDDEWHYTLITGTNRNKTVEEVKASENIESADGWVKITVIGTDELKTLLARLPEGENVFWVDGLIAPAEFAKPPMDVVDNIQAYSQGLGLDFYVSR